jgi:hypothetical protein
VPSLLYQTDGRVKVIHPAGAHWSREELGELVGGYPEVLRTIDGEYMVVNEAFLVLNLDLNIPATRIYEHGREKVIFGPAVVVDSRLELYGRPLDGETIRTT